MPMRVTRRIALVVSEAPHMISWPYSHGNYNNATTRKNKALNPQRRHCWHGALPNGHTGGPFTLLALAVEL